MAKTKKKKRVKKQLKRVISKSKVTKKKVVSKKTAKKAKSNSKQIKNSNNLVKRDKNGRILPGGPGLVGAGRPKGSLSGVRVGQLKQAVIAVETVMSKKKDENGKQNGKTWLQHQIVKSYSDTSLAIAILGRLYPSLKAIEQISFIDDSMSDEKIDEIRKKLSTRFEE